MKLLWTERALADLRDMGDYIALRNPAAALSFTMELMIKAETLVEQLILGRVVPELGREDIRELIYGNYLIVYRVLEGKLHVLTVFEGHRNFRM